MNKDIANHGQILRSASSLISAVTLNRTRASTSGADADQEDDDSPRQPNEQPVEESCTQHDAFGTQVVEEEDELLRSASVVSVAVPEPWARLVSGHKDGLQRDLQEAPPDAQQRYNLHSIGRSANCTVHISDCPRVSNRHCLLYCRLNRADPSNEFLEAWVEDTSANGTYINKTRLQKHVPRLLHRHDEVHLVNPELVRLPATQAKPEEIARDIGMNSFVFMSNLRSPLDDFLAPKPAHSKQQQQQQQSQLQSHKSIRGMNGGTAQYNAVAGNGGAQRLMNGVQLLLSQQQLLDEENTLSNASRRDSDGATTAAAGSSDGFQLQRNSTVARLLGQDRDIHDFYEMKQLLGSGTSGQVFLAVNKATGKHWAVKVIDTRKYLGNLPEYAAGKQQQQQPVNPLELREVTKEAELLRSLRHPHIVHLEDIFAGNRGGHSSIYLVMELSLGGDLFDRILSKPTGRYSEAEARRVMLQILQAIAYLHSKKVAHRDLKPENILLVSRSSDTDVKLTDFGVAKHMHQSGGLKTYCGTPQYYAPEILQRRDYDSSGSSSSGAVAGGGANQIKGNGSSSASKKKPGAATTTATAARKAATYTLAADMWSVGVIMYVLLAGAFPFSESALSEQISRADFSFKAAVWRCVSAEAKQLIRNLLVVDPALRWSAEKALKSPWFSSLRALQSPPTAVAVTTVAAAAVAAVAEGTSSRGASSGNGSSSNSSSSSSGSRNKRERMDNTRSSSIEQQPSKKFKAGGSNAATGSTQQQQQLRGPIDNFFVRPPAPSAVTTSTAVAVAATNKVQRVTRSVSTRLSCSAQLQLEPGDPTSAGTEVD